MGAVGGIRRELHHDIGIKTGYFYSPSEPPGFPVGNSEGLLAVYASLFRFGFPGGKTVVSVRREGESPPFFFQVPEKAPELLSLRAPLQLRKDIFRAVCVHGAVSALFSDFQQLPDM